MHGMVQSATVWLALALTANAAWPGAHTASRQVERGTGDAIARAAALEAGMAGSKGYADRFRADMDGPVPHPPKQLPDEARPDAIAPATRAVEAATPPKMQPGKAWRDPITGMEFAYLPAGEFVMGCGGTWAEDCHDREKPSHTVKLSAFWLGRTEVTQGQWKRIMGYNPSRFQKGDQYPVEQVSWNEVQRFIFRLNDRETGGTFRLPTEAEWEYACRSGGKAVAYGTHSGTSIGKDAANYLDLVGTTTPVAAYPPNALGLYDMSGNVWEWVQDAYIEYAADAAQDPINTIGTWNVVRGGGWYSEARDVRCTQRSDEDPGNRNGRLGFRLVRTP